MNAKVEESTSKLDGLKWAIVFVLIAAAVVGNSYYGAEPLLYRVIAIIVAAILATLIGAQTDKGRAFVDLLKEARIETRKVVWPTRQETLQTTLVVVVVVIFTSLILWGVDSFLGYLVSKLIS